MDKEDIQTFISVGLVMLPGLILGGIGNYFFEELGLILGFFLGLGIGFLFVMDIV